MAKLKVAQFSALSVLPASFSSNLQSNCSFSYIPTDAASPVARIEAHPQLQHAAEHSEQAWESLHRTRLPGLSDFG